MNVIKEWQRRFEAINRSIEQHQEILETEELTQDMKHYILHEIKNKREYKALIEETILLLQKLD